MKIPPELVRSRDLYVSAREGCWDQIVALARSEGYEVEESELPRWAGERAAHWDDRAGTVTVTKR